MKKEDGLEKFLSTIEQHLIVLKNLSDDQNISIQLKDTTMEEILASEIENLRKIASETTDKQLIEQKRTEITRTMVKMIAKLGKSNGRFISKVQKREIS